VPLLLLAFLSAPLLMLALIDALLNARHFYPRPFEHAFLTALFWRRPY